jgi:predicted esterase
MISGFLAVSLRHQNKRITLMILARTKIGTMRKGLLTFCLVLVLSVIFSGVRAQQVFRTTTKTVIPYLEYLPSGYAANSDKYPVVFFLHGIGERGPNTTDLATLESGVWRITKNGPPKLVKYGQKFPFILISIQLKNNYGTWPTWYINEVITHVKTYLRVDESRMHISGLSMGGGGTWTMAQDFPTMFATATPICGGYNSVPKAVNIAGEKLPVWAFHGDADPVVPIGRTKNMVNAINSCSPIPTPKALFTIYAGVNHNSWDRAYTADHSYHSPNIYEWMMSHTNTTRKGNKVPVATAGADKTISTTTLTISGNATDTDGSISKYAWTQMSGPASTMTNTTSRTLTLSGLTDGTYYFRLTATDNSGNCDSDYIMVKVLSGTNKAPLANAGTDKTITLPTSSIKLMGSGTDADGTVSSYKWVAVSGPRTFGITNSTTKTPTVTGMTTAGTYVIQFQVKDNKGGIGTDQVTITVKKATIVASTTMSAADESVTVLIEQSGTDVVALAKPDDNYLKGKVLLYDGDGSESYADAWSSGSVEKQPRRRTMFSSNSFDGVRLTAAKSVFM